MRLTIQRGTILSIIIFAFIGIFIKGQGQNTLITTMLSVATFLFGIIGAYVLSDRHRRIDELQKILRGDDASYLNIYELSKIFGGKVQEKIKHLIDEFIIATIDYKLEDFPKSNKHFTNLFDFIENLKPKGEKQKEAYKQMLDTLREANINRKNIEYLVRDTMIKFKWFVLIGLWLIIIFSMFYLNNNSPFSIIIVVLLSSASVMFLLIIRDLDTLRWKEEQWIWDPLDQLFEELNLLRYYPEQVLQSRRTHIKKGTRVRSAHYPYPYPDFRKKEVKVVRI